MLYKKMRDELVLDIGAVKYVQYFRKSSCGYKILFDNIAFAYFSELKDEKEQQERMKKAANEIRRERSKQNLLMFGKFLAVLHYI